MKTLNQVNIVRILSLVGAIVAVGAVSACASSGGEQSATDYPNKNITVIVPFGAGGTTDAPTRAFAPCLEEELGVYVIIENRECGAGTIGVTKLIGSKPDGYTLGVVSPSSGVVAPLVTENVDYGPDDVTPLGIMYETSSLLAVSSSSPYSSAEELFAAAKSKTIDIATPGANTAYRFEIQRLADEYGLKLQIIPVNDDATVRTSVIGGNVDAMFSTAAPATLELGSSGKLRLLASGGPERPKYIDDIPTLDELGYEGIVYSPTFFALAGPAGLSDQISKTVEGAIESCRADEGVRKLIGEQFMKTDFVSGKEVAERMDTLQSTFKPLTQGG